MSQKAICPRGHIWDPSTLAGLPPSDRPRCPICGEAEPPRVRHVVKSVGRWCRSNPLLAGLTLACLLLCIIVAVTMMRARTQLQLAREEAENAAQQAEKARRETQKARQALVAEEGGADGRHLAREVEMEAAKWRGKIDELRKEAREAKEWRNDAVKQRDEQARARKVAEELAKSAEEVRQEALAGRSETVRKLIALHAANGTRLMENGDLAPAVLWFAEALRLAQSERLPEETHRLRLSAVLAGCPRPRQLWTHDGKVNAVQLSPNGKRVLMAGANGAVVVRDAATGQRIGEPLAHATAVSHASFSPDGKRVLTATTDMTIHVWDLETSKEVFPALQFRGPIVSLSFSPDGRHFLTVAYKPAMDAASATEAELRLWNAATGEALAEQALGSDISPRPAVFSRDGKRVLAICQDRCARIWDITTEKQVGAAFTHAAALVGASFSSDGARVLTASAGGTVRLWHTDTAEPVGPPLKHGAALLAADLDPNGRFVLTIGADHGVRIWDARTGEAIGPPLRHDEAVSRAVFSPDGRYVLTACANGEARLWDFTTAEEVLPPLHHGRAILDAAFTPAGDSMLTLAGHSVRLWDLTAAERSTTPAGHSETGQKIRSADGKLELRITEAAVRVYDTQKNEAIGGTLPHKNKVTAAAFSRDNKYVLTVSHQPNGDELEGVIQLWETATGRPAGEPLIHPRSVLEANFSPEGKRVLTACQDRKARLWDVKKGIVIGEPMEHKEDLRRALFIPDGSRILTLDAEGGLRLWDGGTAEAVGPAWGHQKPLHHLAFSPDGRLVVTAGEDGLATVWEAASGREVAATAPHGAAVLYAAFSPDGKRIVTVSADRMARVWDAANGKPVTRPLRHHAALARGDFSADGRRLITVAADGVRLWDVATGEPLAPLLRSSKDQPAIENVALKPDDRPASDLLLFAQLLEGERLEGSGETTPLDGGELSKTWQMLQKKYGKDFVPSGERTAAWHRRGAAECERQQLWAGCVLHLDRLIAGGESAELYARRAQAHAALKHWEPAKADYTKALAGHAERWDLWAGRGAAETALGRWEQAAADYSKAIERRGDQAELWVGRGRAEAERGDWKKAAADLGKAVHLGEGEVSVWCQHALALLAAGNEAEYRRTCGRLMQHFRSKEDEAAIQAIAWTCALTQGAVRDLKPLLERTEAAAAANPRSAENRRCLALLLYRSSQFDAALKRLEDATHMPDADANPRDWLLLAMAAQRLGRSDDAKKWLDKGAKLATEKKSSPHSWDERLIYQTLHREAETLVKESKK